ncbi:MAG: hypothetical protein IKX71_00555 [Bacteroidales bacterium]|nr:hypothetical protein [Bacteroidales bacterium]
MTYLEAVQLVKDIESKYDVMSIRYRNVSVWPYLRLYLFDGISDKTEIKPSVPVVKIVLKSLFAYNPFKVFKHHDVWLFTGCERRKRIGDKMIHRISGGISTNVDSCLMIEKPHLLLGHYKKKEIEEKDIVSESWLLALFHLIERLSSITRPRIENEDVIKRILAENNISFDYRRYVKKLDAKRKSLRCLLRIAPKPRLVLMECPYDSMGYIWACRQKGIRFLELQHGVAGKSHNAYNARFYEPLMQPDGICVFGSEEYRYFTEEEPQYTPNVYMTGLYMLEKADEFFVNDVFGKDRERYSKVIVASGQNGYERQLSEFIDKVAGQHGDYLFVYIPRMADADLNFSASNVRIERNVNIYEYLKWADIHITISSTTCLEAQYFCTPTIFFDYDRRASTYYGQLLKEENGAVYIEDEKEFDKALEVIQGGDFQYKEVFVHNHVDRIVKVIQG